MKIILVTDVKKVGTRGAVVTVADGYAMNVLIPKRQAIVATPENLKRHDVGLKEAAQKADHSATQAKELLNQVNGKTLEILVKASETGTLFKSLHQSDIADEVKKQWSIDVPVSAFKLEEPIKKKGSYEVPISLLGTLAKITVTLA